MDIQLLVFDLDGTLIDSKMDIALAVNLTLEKFGIEHLPISLIEAHVGTGVMPLILQTLRDYGVEKPEEGTEIFNHFYLQHLTDRTHLYEGMMQVLERFRNFPKVILTNKSNLFLVPVLERLRLAAHFKAAYGRESFATRKPDAGPLREIGSRYNVDINKIVMIGDTEVDMGAGLAAGTLTCAVNYGYGSPESLAFTNPTFTVDTVSEIITVLEPHLISG